MIGEAIVLLGAVLVLLAAIGVVFVTIGSTVVLPTWNDDTSTVAAAVLQLLTLPISASLIARATYRAPEIEHHLDDVDELAEAEGEGDG